LDPRLDAICLKAMARDVAERYATMNELAAALDDYLTKSARPPMRALAALLAVGGGALLLLGRQYLPHDGPQGLARVVKNPADPANSSSARTNSETPRTENVSGYSGPTPPERPGGAEKPADIAADKLRALAESLKDKEAAVRRAAAVALGKAGPRAR